MYSSMIFHKPRKSRINMLPVPQICPLISLPNHYPLPFHYSFHSHYADFMKSLIEIGFLLTFMPNCTSLNLSLFLPVFFNFT